MRFAIGSAGLVASAGGAFLLAACAAGSTAVGQATAPSSSASSLHPMNQTIPHTKPLVAQLIAALQSEQMLKMGFFVEASLQQWFGPHRWTSTPSPLKQGVQREALDFGSVKLDLIHAQAGGGLSFSLRGPSPWGLKTLMAEDLIALLGEPHKKVDVVGEQMRRPPTYPTPEAGQPVISPQPVRQRGETTHPWGNHDMLWSLRSQASVMEFTASINGDGSVRSVFGRQETP